jgi:hypothetical protein
MKRSLSLSFISLFLVFLNHTEAGIAGTKKSTDYPCVCITAKAEDMKNAKNSKRGIPVSAKFSTNAKDCRVPTKRTFKRSEKQNGKSVSILFEENCTSVTRSSVPLEQKKSVANPSLVK